MFVVCHHHVDKMLRVEMFFVCDLLVCLPTFWAHVFYSDDFCLKGVQPAEEFYLLYLHAEFVFRVLVLASHERPRRRRAIPWTTLLGRL